MERALCRTNPTVFKVECGDALDRQITYRMLLPLDDGSYR
jgi:hypothetical protein